MTREEWRSVEQPSQLPGMILFVYLAAPVLALPLLLGLPALYRRAVVRGMRALGGPRAPGEPATPATPSASPPGPLELTRIGVEPPVALTGDAAHRFEQASSGPPRQAALRAVAAVPYALSMAVLWSVASGTPGGPIRILTLATVFAWAGCLVFLVLTTDRRATWRRAIATYAGVAAAVFVLAVATNEELTFGQLILLFALMNLPASLLFVLLLRPRMRTVGPLVLPVLYAGVSGSVALTSLIGASDEGTRSAASVGSAFGLGAGWIFAGILLTGAVLSLPIGAGLIRWIGRSYERKTTSDNQILCDAICLLFAVSQTLSLVVDGLAWMLAAPAAFLVWRTAAVTLVRRSARPPHPGARLLLLRVFALGRRSEQLFAALEAHWRVVGSIQLIAGPDLAVRTLEPNELIAFATGRLRRLFVGDLAALDRRVTELDLLPDPDGRFRVNEFLCRDDTWRPTLARLVGTSDAVLMDLRGFGRAHEGCRHELNELVARVPLARVVIAVDETTDDAYLDEVLAAAWRALPGDSPNRSAPGAGRLTLLRTDGGSGDLPQLLRCLCAASAATSGS